MIPVDIFFQIIEHSDFTTIKKLCQTNSTFYNLCKTYPKEIERIKCKSLQKLINENDYKIREFALINKYIFDDKSKTKFWSIQSSNQNQATVYDKIWVDLMFLLSKHYYSEAETLIICSKLPDPPMGLFIEKYMVNIPPKIMKLLWQHLGNILDVAGYDNKEDLLEDYRDGNLQIPNQTMRDIITDQLRNL